jgi:RimJ/RimL family protein N-acetyltransferase
MILYQEKPIGEMNYSEVSADTCEIGIKICDFSMQNKGLGKKILSLFIRTLFNELGYRRIILDTNINNLRAQHVYESLGFRKLRVNENCWQDQLGVWQSAVDYELTKENFVSFL